MSAAWRSVEPAPPSTRATEPPGGHGQLLQCPQLQLRFLAGGAALPLPGGAVERLLAPPATAPFPCLPRGDCVYSPLGNRYEQTQRPRPRHPRPAPPEDSGPPALARVGDRAAPQVSLRRRAAGQRRLPLPRPAQAGAGRLDRGRVEADGEQPARQVLHAHPPGQEAARRGGGELATAVLRHLAGRAALGGLESDAHRTLVVHGADRKSTRL